MSWQTSLQKKLITRFSSESYLITSGEVKELSINSLIPQVIVGRDISRYFSIDLSHVPKAKREMALMHQVEVRSIWKNTGHCVYWQAGIAQVWFWDNDLLENRLSSGGGNRFSKSRFRGILSEIQYLQKPIKDGVYLVSVVNGFDLQCWVGSVLVASQWSAVLPSDHQVGRFIRSQGLQLGADAVKSLPAESMQSLWPGALPSVWEYWLDQKGKAFVILAMFSLILGSLQLTSVLRWQYIERDLQERSRLAGQSAEALLTARSKARNAALDASEVFILFDGVDVLGLHDHFQRSLPPELKLLLVKWERNLNDLDITVEGDVVDTLGLVRSLTTSVMKNVTVTPAGKKNQYRIQMKIDGSRLLIQGRGSE